MKSAVIRFPGSNCERDAFDVLFRTGLYPEYVWHDESALPDGLDLVVIPGGFTYGDYLRCGAMAAHSPIMQAVKAFAEAGGLVLGICNGFQILCEAGLLPGTLLRNAHLRFRCSEALLRVERADTPFTRLYHKGQVITVPVAHHDGRYFAADDVVERLEGEGQILFRYCNAQGWTDESANPNGSVGNIAGILNARGNILGMMPHPERHAEALTGGTDGSLLFESFLRAAA